MTDIAIIGGGAAGAAVFGELLRRLGRDDSVHWITGSDAPGRGVAYATDDPRHVLNVRAAGMSLMAQPADAFLRHVEHNLDGVTGTDFLPRGVFGDFVQAQIRTAMEAARTKGPHVAVHAHRATAVHRDVDGGYRLVHGQDAVLKIDALVLAVGALPARPMRNVSSAALGSGAYVLDPWCRDEPSHAPRKVLVIGTGLTAVDTLISAATRWPRAELVAVSRHGCLPFAHAVQPLAPYPFQNDLNTSLLACDGPLAVLHHIRAAVDAAPDVHWHAIIDGMRPVNARLWQAFSPAQRRRFLRHLRWLWESVRHRAAPAPFATVQALLDSGRLEVRAARVLAVDGNGPLQVMLRERRSGREDTLQADRVVQATGLDTAVGDAGDPLLSQMLRDGLVKPDALQLGLAAGTDGCLHDADGRPQATLLALGALLRGTLWECTAMPEIRLAAANLGQMLAQWHPGQGDS